MVCLEQGRLQLVCEETEEAWIEARKHEALNLKDVGARYRVILARQNALLARLEAIKRIFEHRLACGICKKCPPVWQPTYEDDP
jgi:hypothetical protein